MLSRNHHWPRLVQLYKMMYKDKRSKIEYLDFTT
jgi:hypothetical protein